MEAAFIKYTEDSTSIPTTVIPSTVSPSTEFPTSVFKTTTFPLFTTMAPSEVMEDQIHSENEITSTDLFTLVMAVILVLYMIVVGVKWCFKSRMRFAGAIRGYLGAIAVEREVDGPVAPVAQLHPAVLNVDADPVEVPDPVPVVDVVVQVEQITPIVENHKVSKSLQIQRR